MKVKFPAMQATIGKRQYYSTTMALSEIPRFFKFNDWAQFEPQQRAQRVLNVTRVPEITKYILDNENGYIFSSITASYNCPVTFTPNDQDEWVGTIEMDLEEMEFIINDGQHRCAAIAAALKVKPELAKERISVLLFPTEDLDRLQQMFSDLNRFVHKTSKSLDILYDHRDNLSALTMMVADQVPAFQKMVDMEKMSIPLRSPKLLTLSALYDANSELLGSTIEHPESKLFQEKVTKAIAYWTEVAKVIPDWQAVKEKRLAAPALRQEKINTHAIVLRALGGVGNALFSQYSNDWHKNDDWRKCLQGLKTVDWRKSVDGRVNPLWDNVCIVAGSVVSNRQARAATLAILKRELELPLSSQEQMILTNLREDGRGNSQTEKEHVAKSTMDSITL
jgi:DNA sulfur modification protein DndB